MYNSKLENSLLFPDIGDRISDYCGIQLDVNDVRVKAACIVAQDLDIAFVIGQENWERCFEDNSNYSQDLFGLICAPVCFFTYSRLVSMMQANYTDSGMAVEDGVISIDEAKSASKQYRAIGEQYLSAVVKFLTEENPSTEATMDKSILRVRSFGGEEIPSPGSGRSVSGTGITWENKSWNHNSHRYN